MKKNVLLVSGGGDTEHEISLESANFIATQIDPDKFNVIEVIIEKDGTWNHYGEKVFLNNRGELAVANGNLLSISAVIPCLHGNPGETGHFQASLDLLGVPYFGCSFEASVVCFNKIILKHMMDHHGIANTPYQSLYSKNITAEDFFERHQDVYVKAAKQGSSVGCFPVQKKEDLQAAINKAFNYSNCVVVEKTIKGRELEMSLFVFKGEVHATRLGEIVSPSTFYSYEEKYDRNSQAKTVVEAEGISEEMNNAAQSMAKKLYHIVGLRHLSRVDFLLEESTGELFVNEINTFPGHTSISMFPMMMENFGVKYSDFLNSHLESLTSS